MRKKVIVLMLVLALMGLAGCESRDNGDRAQVYIEEYEKIEYETVAVERGDITPQFVLVVYSDGFYRKNYYPMLDNVEVEQVYVKKGDTVKEGDVMITFKSGDISEQIEKYENKLNQDIMLVDHYSNLMSIDPTLDYSADIKLIKDDIEVCNLYIEELKSKLSLYNVVAEGTGMVTMILDRLDYGYVNTADNIMSVSYGTGEYYATTQEDYDFKIGDVYEGSYSTYRYSLELTDIQDVKNENGEDEKKLYFKLAMDGVAGVDNMQVILSKETLENVLYLPEKSVFYANGSNYVYMLDENGYREAVEVKTGEVIDEYVVIESGLEEGDKVVIY